ncbi:pyridoxal-phosphate dependent enzyme [Polaribacter sp. IC073]|uniref:pyridoxal-phosphate dependent enzyme n=1 Tax=Polaribacter sp. IC073 TaxID=2508540 RepID=UPI0011BFCB86|nr:pyridoxal-phosphate dependent enzyme [Polaribacter sp. IC073]TXD47753.1 pyridoxal-phosphate dependent enzyme [Polaribacter sp. IC073]
MKYTDVCQLEDLMIFLEEIDSYFKPKLSSRVNLDEYAIKLLLKANFLNIYENTKLVSSVIYYLNESKSEAYIPIIATLKNYRGKGYFSYMLDELDKIMILRKITFLRLETWEGNKALNLYLKKSFVIEERIQDRSDGNFSIKLVKTYNDVSGFKFSPTPLDVNERLNSEVNVSVYIKRDDLFPIIGGGSKGRKLKYILKKAIEEGCTSVVTAGSCSSNHLRATAVLCAELGLKLTACIHDEKPAYFEGNIKLTKLYSNKITFCKMAEIKEVMDLEMNKLIALGEKPFYIWGGGHCNEGTYAYYLAVKELKEQLKGVKPDYIFIASGTGGTQAGIELGVQDFLPECKVIGVSIAREFVRGDVEVKKSIKSFIDRFNIGYESSNIIFDDSYLCGGYGKVNDDYIAFLKYYSKKFGLTLDPTYSGKAFYAMIDYIKKNKIKEKSKVVFWNTGGILNISSSVNF